MIKSAMTALSKDFGLSKSRTEDIIQTMIRHVQQDVKSPAESGRENKTVEAMTDEDKIMGLEKMVEDKVSENDLNLEEVRLWRHFISTDYCSSKYSLLYQNRTVLARDPVMTNLCSFRVMHERTQKLILTNLFELTVHIYS